MLERIGECIMCWLLLPATEEGWNGLFNVDWNVEEYDYFDYED